MSASPGVLLALRMIWSGGWLDPGALLPAAVCSWEARAILLLAVPAFARALVLLDEVRSLAMVQLHKALTGSIGCWEDGRDSDGDGVGAAGAVIMPGPRQERGGRRRGRRGGQGSRPAGAGAARGVAAGVPRASWVRRRFCSATAAGATAWAWCDVECLD